MFVIFVALCVFVPLYKLSHMEIKETMDKKKRSVVAILLKKKNKLNFYKLVLGVT